MSGENFRVIVEINNQLCSNYDFPRS